ncbi:hypothetical protein EJC47_17065 [Sphingomonas sp. TF3]|uniref:hypothetical protein n=1 Tax=Sphingomonas sp. TF3 TaxID=2495580 RepID=UPI000F87B7FA|nr:hypothetical protein [Sphingomonas sp. TF3]RUN75252.1 hypothetical protein EJC47_17065 [Sphingomonas sp. TF3]
MLLNMKVDPDTIGQMVVEGIAIIKNCADDDNYILEDWFSYEAKQGDALRPLQQLMPVACGLLEDASILNDVGKQLRVAVAHDALSGLLSLYGIEA